MAKNGSKVIWHLSGPFLHSEVVFKMSKGLINKLNIIVYYSCVWHYFFAADEDEYQKEEQEDGDEEEGYLYELTGVTVHTGTADGGHYYSFIRDKLRKTEMGQHKW